VWKYTSTPPIRLHSVVLVQAQGQLLLYSIPASLIILEVGFVCNDAKHASCLHSHRLLTSIKKYISYKLSNMTWYKNQFPVCHLASATATEAVYHQSVKTTSYGPAG